jgi:hypothetical protein
VNGYTTKLAVIALMMGAAAVVAIWGKVSAGDAALIVLVALVASCTAA